MAPARLKTIAKAYQAATARLLLLDYDGTLAPFASSPDKAKPSASVLAALQHVAADPANTVAVISGRNQASMEAWLGQLPIGLIAEHGAFEKPAGGTWQTCITGNSSWLKAVRPIFEAAAGSTDGAFLEDKTAGITFHYRMADDADEAACTAQELAGELALFTSTLPINVLHSAMAVEAHDAQANKGIAANRWLARETFDFGLCSGDSATDEDMFVAVPQSVFTVKVGPGDSAARYRLATPEELVTFLAGL